MPASASKREHAIVNECLNCGDADKKRFAD